MTNEARAESPNFTRLSYALQGGNRRSQLSKKRWYVDRSTLPVWSPQTREKGQQKQESRQLDQRDKSTKSVQETVINKTVSNQGSKGVNTIQEKTRYYTITLLHYYFYFPAMLPENPTSVVYIIYYI